MSDDDQQLEWFRVVDADELPSGRVMTVTAGTRSMALTNIDGEFTVMDNRCPRQGGAVGNGPHGSDRASGSGAGGNHYRRRAYLAARRSASPQPAVPFPREEIHLIPKTQVIHQAFAGEQVADQQR